jgi:peptide chain release factor 2
VTICPPNIAPWAVRPGLTMADDIVRRSQHRNRSMAMAMLKARLYEAELQKREAAAAAVENAKTDIGWGRQIRDYVLAPYQLVKDLRTGVEKGNPDAVPDGDLDGFIAAALAARASGEARRRALHQWMSLD